MKLRKQEEAFIYMTNEVWCPGWVGFCGQAKGLNARSKDARCFESIFLRKRQQECSSAFLHVRVCYQMGIHFISIRPKGVLENGDSVMDMGRIPPPQCRVPRTTPTRPEPRYFEGSWPIWDDVWLGEW